MSIVVTPIPRLIDLAAPAFTLGTVNAAGAAVTAVASDSTLLAFDAVAVDAITLGQSGSVGVSTVAPRRDHAHAMEDVTVATQAEMEADSSTTVFVTPGRTRYSPGVAKIWVGINADGTNDGDYNLTSTGKDSTGVYSVTMAADMASENFAAVASARTVNATMAMVTTFVVGAYKVQTEDDGDTLVDAASYTGAWGPQA